MRLFAKQPKLEADKSMTIYFYLFFNTWFFYKNILLLGLIIDLSIKLLAKNHTHISKFLDGNISLCYCNERMGLYDQDIRNTTLVQLKVRIALKQKEISNESNSSNLK